MTGGPIVARFLLSLTLSLIHGETEKPNDEDSRGRHSFRGSPRRAVPTHHAMRRCRLRCRRSGRVVQADDAVHDGALPGVVGAAGRRTRKAWRTLRAAPEKEG